MVGGACASGNLSIRNGFRDIVSGYYQQALTVGSRHLILGPLDLYASECINATVVKPYYQDHPEKASASIRQRSRRICLLAWRGGRSYWRSWKAPKLEASHIYGEVLGVKSQCQCRPSSAAQRQGAGEINERSFDGRRHR